MLGSLLLDFDLRKGRVAIEITLAAMVLLGDIGFWKMLHLLLISGGYVKLRGCSSLHVQR